MYLLYLNSNLILQPLDTRHLELPFYFDYACSITVSPKAVYSKETKSLNNKFLIFQGQHCGYSLFSHLEIMSVSMIILITYLPTCVLFFFNNIYTAIPLTLEYNFYESRNSTPWTENSVWHYKNHCINTEWVNSIIN